MLIGAPMACPKEVSIYFGRAIGGVFNGLGTCQKRKWLKGEKINKRRLIGKRRKVFWNTIVDVIIALETEYNEI